METSELAGLSFRCLEGCGFCCTFQPEVSRRELALLRARFRPTPVSVASDGERTYLGLQNKCGACTLLERRGCTAYDLRPAHCRYFPFHVHFAEVPEVYVNYTCRGVERVGEDADLSAAFRASVLDVAKPDAWERHEREARDTYAEFRRRARKAGAWREARPRVDAGTLALGEARHEDALAPFAEADVTKRPFYLAPDLRWLTFERDGDRLHVLEMDEKGDLVPWEGPGGRGAKGPAELRGIDAWHAPDAAPLLPYLARLVRRRSFLGSVYAIVDAEDYALDIEAATEERLGEIAADLALRQRILRALGQPSPDEVARFYDSQFLDAPTIGGWL